VQDVFVILCANSFAALRQFRGERPEALVTYLRTIAASVAVDSIRASNAKKRGSGRVSQFADEDASDVIHNAEVKNRDRWIFWTYYRHGLTSRAISRIASLNLSQKGVESTIHRMVRQVRDCLEKRTSAEGKLAGSPS
jgi:RNA polymerase sigma-70 factor (ECF subfamily)